MNTIAPPVAVTHGSIHFARTFPVSRTTCGLSRVPAASSWDTVTCPRCLEVGARLTPAAGARRDQLAAEAAAREHDQG